MPAIPACLKSHQENLALSVIVVIGLTVRLSIVDQPMRADESSTSLSYAKASLREALAYRRPEALRG